jgi:MauM/NapG family ferredoxin protein
MHGAEGVLMLVRPLALDAGWNQLAFAEPPLRAYPTWTVALGFVALLVAFARLAPRFWCRYCCPAGALFALASRRSLLRRRVGEECVECGKCAKACPSGAAADSPATDPSLCLLCMSCRKACPARTVDFGFDTSRTPAAPPAPGAVGLSGRRTAMATIAGFGLGAAFLPTQGVGRTSVLRPPGALPEEDFLARCVRCGECAALCPTGTIRPLWFASGAIGLFSPAIDPVAAPCDPRCTTCGEACPTRALLPLDRTARPLARPGVAVVIRKTCLAWEDKKKCLVCDEVCPFDAVVLKDEPGNPIQVPHVVAERCAGCGYCEYHCPARPDAMELLSTGEERAIVVRPEGALRLENADYVAEAKRRGLDIRLRQEPGQGPPPGAFPDDPGYDGAEEDETPAEETLPPGFILD